MTSGWIVALELALVLGIVLAFGFFELRSVRRPRVPSVRNDSGTRRERPGR